MPELPPAQDHPAPSFMLAPDSLAVFSDECFALFDEPKWRVAAWAAASYLQRVVITKKADLEVPDFESSLRWAKDQETRRQTGLRW